MWLWIVAECHILKCQDWKWLSNIDWSTGQKLVVTADYMEVIKRPVVDTEPVYFCISASLYLLETSSSIHIATEARHGLLGYT